MAEDRVVHVGIGLAAAVAVKIAREQKDGLAANRWRGRVSGTILNYYFIDL